MTTVYIEDTVNLATKLGGMEDIAIRLQYHDPDNKEADSQEPDEVIFNSDPDAAWDSPRTVSLGKIQWADQGWTVEILPLTEVLASYKDARAWLIMIFGLMSACFASLFTLNSLIQSDELKETVAQKTEEVKNRQLEMENSARLASLGEMAAQIAHEINNPLTIIKGSSMKLQLMSRENRLDTETVKTIHQQIDATIERITKIIRGLTKFSRDGSHEAFEFCNINDVLREAYQFAEDSIRRQGIDFSLVAAKGNTRVECRPIQISQVLINLINNARSAISDQPGDRFIRLHFLERMNTVEILVIDSGKGIDAERQKKLFEPFFTTKASGEGTGLGLSISRSIIEAHHGAISIDSDSPNTCFKIVLPKQQPQINTENASLDSQDFENSNQDEPKKDHNDAA